MSAHSHATDETTHHLFKNTNNTVLAMFKQIHAVSTICLCLELGTCFSGCCCAGIIVALWAGFVLADDQVRAAFY